MTVLVKQPSLEAMWLGSGFAVHRHLSKISRPRAEITVPYCYSNMLYYRLRDTALQIILAAEKYQERGFSKSSLNNVNQLLSVSVVVEHMAFYIVQEHV